MADSQLLSHRCFTLQLSIHFFIYSLSLLCSGVSLIVVRAGSFLPYSCWAYSFSYMKQQLFWLCCYWWRSCLLQEHCAGVISLLESPRSCSSSLPTCSGSSPQNLPT